MGATALAVGAIGGTALEIYGQVQANKQEAAAELINAEFYKKQADFAIESSDRAAEIFNYDTALLQGDQLSAIGRSGVQASGSPMMFLAQESVRADKELDAINREGEVNAEMANFRAQQSLDKADSLTGFKANFLPALGTVINNGTKLAGSLG